MIDTKMKRKIIPEFIDIANKYRSELKREIVYPCGLVKPCCDENGRIRVIPDGSIWEMAERPLGKGQSVCLDFGNHYVGFVKLKLKSVGSVQDAPAYIRLKFGEMPQEITADSAEYDGWISRSWIQEEYLHIDVLPAEIQLPRRYALRYLEIYAVDTSMKWKITVADVSLETVSAVKEDAPHILADSVMKGADPFKRELIERIDEVSIRTLKNCMQDVFEDGPKRDRRLWLGDLRLQALTNYQTFRNFGLVKRCLYLFAGLTRADGRVGACLFTEPEYIVDDVFFFDYSLFFISALYDYYKASGDKEALKDLWDCAYRQMQIISEEFDEKNMVELGESGCFIDWKAGLHKQAAAQAVYIYCGKQALELAKIMGRSEAVQWMETEIREKTNAARKYFFDSACGLFVSGPERQVSVASQVWMILAGVVTPDEGREILERVSQDEQALGMVTPYMNHCYTEAILVTGQKQKALDYILYYWGGMVKEEADTFWELYNPENPDESPYGSSMVNSYCHAWSCTPAYLFRKFF